jgi:SAM-dependent methyltransferase
MKTDSLRIKLYGDYDEYVKHQASKLENGISWLENYKKYYFPLLTTIIEYLQHNKHLSTDGSVLCLGARCGTEVLAFRQSGYQAIGVDLNPGENNPLVVKGDFHYIDLQFEPQDIIYTNALDHILKPELFFPAIHRALKTGGKLFVLYASAEAVAKDRFASFGWEKFADVIELISTYKLKLVNRTELANSPFFEGLAIFEKLES